MNKKVFDLYNKSKKILTNNSATIITHSIDLLNFPYAFHEYFIERKKKILKKNIFEIIILLFFNIIKSNIIWILIYLKNFFKKKEFETFEQKVVIISHFVDQNSNKFNPKRDWVFNKIYENLEQNLGTIKFILFNYSKLEEKKIESNALFLKKSLSLCNELKILINQIKETKNIFFNFFLKKKIDFITCLQILSSIFTTETRSNLRLYIQFLEIQKKNEIKLLFFTYEGFSWEKLLIYSSREINLDCKLVGYQFSYIPKNASWVEFKKNKYCPDYIFTGGNFNKKKILKKNNFYKKKIFNVGSNKCFYVKKKSSTKLNCLIIPKGTFVESEAMLILSIKLARLYPSTNFIIRHHPFINLLKIFKKNFKLESYKPKNLIISKNSLKKDIKISNLVIYRGSALILSAVINKSVPVYYKYLDNKNNIDPISDTKIKKFIIKNEIQFKKILENLQYFDKKKIIKNQKFALDFFSRFKKKNISNFYKIINI